MMQNDIFSTWINCGIRMVKLLSSLNGALVVTIQVALQNEACDQLLNFLFCFNRHKGNTQELSSRIGNCYSYFRGDKKENEPSVFFVEYKYVCSTLPPRRKNPGLNHHCIRANDCMVNGTHNDSRVMKLFLFFTWKDWCYHFWFHFSLRWWKWESNPHWTYQPLWLMQTQKYAGISSNWGRKLLCYCQREFIILLSVIIFLFSHKIADYNYNFQFYSI